MKIKTIALSSAIAAALAFTGSAHAFKLGSGSTSGMFYPTAQHICGKAAEAFVPCEVEVSDGSSDNVKRVNSGEFDGGIAMLPVAEGSGLKHETLQVGEAAFVVANPTASGRIMGLVGNMEAAVFPAALKLAAKGRITFVTMGAGSGETAMMRDQLAAAGAPESALVTVDGIDAFMAHIKANDTSFGYFTRIPSPANQLFQQVAEQGVTLLGAYNPAFKGQGTRIDEVSVAGFTVKTPVTPVTIVYDPQNPDAKDVVEIAKKVTVTDLVPKEKKGIGAAIWAKLKSAGVSMKEMSLKAKADMEAAIQERLADV